MPRVHLNNLLTATVSRYGMCFWDGRQHATKYEQYEKDGKAYAEFEEVSEVSNTSPNARIWSLLNHDHTLSVLHYLLLLSHLYSSILS